MNCAKCNKGFTCGCQKTKAADGKIVHKTCLKDYNTANGGVVYGSTDSFTRQVQKAKETIKRKNNKKAKDQRKERRQDQRETQRT